MSQIQIKRQWNFIAMVRKFNVYIDEQKAGQIANNSTVTYQTTPGAHTVFVDMKGGKSNTIEIEVADDSTTELIVKPSSFDTYATLLTIPFIGLASAMSLVVDGYFVFSTFLVIYTSLYFAIRGYYKVTAFVITEKK